MGYRLLLRRFISLGIKKDISPLLVCYFPFDVNVARLWKFVQKSLMDERNELACLWLAKRSRFLSNFNNTCSWFYPLVTTGLFPCIWHNAHLPSHSNSILPSWKRYSNFLFQRLSITYPCRHWKTKKLCVTVVLLTPAGSFDSTCQKGEKIEHCNRRPTGQ